MKNWQLRAGRPSDERLLSAWRGQGGGVSPPGLAERQEDWLVAEWRDPGRPGPASQVAHAGATLRLRHGIGLGQRRFWYHVGCVVHAAPELQLFHRQNTLLLGSDYCGAVELAEAAFDPGLSPAEQAQAWRVLLTGAQMLLAGLPEARSRLLITELPGWRDAAGQSPFWQGLGAHFHDADPQQALRERGAGWRADVASLMPQHPVYTSFLASAAEAAIGRCAEPARVWLDAVAEAGLRYGRHVTLDDAGPVFEAPVDTLAGVVQVRRWPLELARQALDPGAAGVAWWVLRTDGAAGADALFVARGELRGTTLVLDPAAAALWASAPPPSVWGITLGP